MFLFVHLVFAAINIYDVWADSRLKKKGPFVLLILMVPVAGMLTFHRFRRKLGPSEDRMQLIGGSAKEVSGFGSRAVQHIFLNKGLIQRYLQSGNIQDLCETLILPVYKSKVKG